jgi:FKBP-type peptidyl-prolyl cis-trans isomerase
MILSSTDLHAAGTSRPLPRLVLPSVASGSLCAPGRCARWIALALIALAAAHAGAQPSPELKTAESKASYAIGVDMARNLKRLGTEVELDLVIRGLQDGLSGEKLIIPEKEFRQVLINIQTVARRKQAQYRGHSVGEINLKRGELFLEENKAKAGVVALPSGLQFQVIRAGTGGKPTEADTVECYYRGTLLDGAEFICTNPGQPATVKVKEADCPGWKEALQLMTVGSKWKCYLPAKLAYGPRGVGRDIGPSETIILELELLAIK